MASRYSAARPKRAGELYAREIHGHRDEAAAADTDADAAPSKKVKFDVRNPSNLAPDAREEDDVLDADVIGRGGLGTKRGAVNVDGYDSDSDNETFLARAARRGGPADTRAGMSTGSGFSKEADDEVKVDLIDQLDNYDKRLRDPSAGGTTTAATDGDDDDDDDDMFADQKDDDDDDAPKAGKDAAAAAGRKTWKEVRFLGADAILGQEDNSRAGGRVRLEGDASDADDSDDSDDSEAALARQEVPDDDEVGAGGRKTHAPKLDAFNMRQEQEEGAFDEAGNYLRKAADPDAQHDRWLDGINKKAVRAAAAAHAQREAALHAQRAADDGLATADLLAALLRRLERGETVLEALARLGRVSGGKRQPKGRGKKTEAMAVDVHVDTPQAQAQAQAKADIEALTEAADHLLNRDFPDIYDTERERLQRAYRAETGEDWAEEGRAADDDRADDRPWEYRWADGRTDNPVQGPFDGATMQAWQDAGYFAGGIEVRRQGGAAWEQRTSFV